MLAVATRLLERSRCRVQVDSMLFSRRWRYLDKGQEQKVPSAGHRLPLPSSGEGTFQPHIENSVWSWEDWDGMGLLSTVTCYSGFVSMDFS